MYEEIPDDLFEQAMMLKASVDGLAGGGSLEEDLYLRLRSSLKDSPVSALVPRFVRIHRTEKELWAYLKTVASNSGSYAARRKHISEEFAPLLDRLESADGAPADAGVSETLSAFDETNVHAIWQKALERRGSDPEGAITTARTLLESVCKHILDSAEVPYTDKDDLPKLYKATAEFLTLAPSQHTEPAFKAILQSCHTVVQNLGALRNKIGDAHGHGTNRYKPAPRHAELAVNLAGSTATFLVATWNDRKQD